MSYKLTVSDSFGPIIEKPYNTIRSAWAHADRIAHNLDVDSVRSEILQQYKNDILGRVEGGRFSFEVSYEN